MVNLDIIDSSVLNIMGPGLDSYLLSLPNRYASSRENLKKLKFLIHFYLI